MSLRKYLVSWVPLSGPAHSTMELLEAHDAGDAKTIFEQSQAFLGVSMGGYVLKAFGDDECETCFGGRKRKGERCYTCKDTKKTPSAEEKHSP